MQLTYALAYAALLFLREHDAYSIDAMISNKTR
jgi:hypothetical protein